MEDREPAIRSRELGEGLPRFTFYLHEFLLRMSVRPYLTPRVVPAALGAHAAMRGAFTFLEFADFHPADTALSEGESRKLIATLATELSADREDHDDRA